MKQRSLAIAIPGESMPLEAVRCYGRLMLRFMSHPIPGLGHLSQAMFSASILPYARAKVVEMALSQGASHVLMLDTDMTYPETLVERLLAHDRPFVACNATTRRPPIRWCAKDKAGHEMDSSKGRGLQKAGSCGLAVALIERCVFEAIPTPRFFFEWTGAGWRGEDIWFCDRAIERGFQPMIDHDLSREIGHVGNHTYTCEDVAGSAQADESSPI